MKNRRTCCETNSQKSAHRVRSLVCETNKFGDRDNSKVPASKRKCIYICTACRAHFPVLGKRKTFEKWMWRISRWCIIARDWRGNQNAL